LKAWERGGSRIEHGEGLRTRGCTIKKKKLHGEYGGGKGIERGLNGKFPLEGGENKHEEALRGGGGHPKDT